MTSQRSVVFAEPVRPRLDTGRGRHSLKDVIAPSNSFASRTAHRLGLRVWLAAEPGRQGADPRRSTRKSMKALTLEA
jgi:hypothetical protein